MLAFEHLHANALLVVLIVTALAIVLLRVVVHLSQRALAARDRAIIAEVERAPPKAVVPGNERAEQQQ
jgi:type IV secretory pathway VirB3-like protein